MHSGEVKPGVAEVVLYGRAFVVRGAYPDTVEGQKAANKQMLDEDVGGLTIENGVVYLAAMTDKGRKVRP